MNWNIRTVSVIYKDSHRLLEVMFIAIPFEALTHVNILLICNISLSNFIFNTVKFVSLYQFLHT